MQSINVFVGPLL